MCSATGAPQTVAAYAKTTSMNAWNIEKGNAGPVHKYRRANAIAKRKARPSAIPTRITVCAFGRFEGGFCGGVTSHLVTQSTCLF
jgi:hypothetical protein